MSKGIELLVTYLLVLAAIAGTVGFALSLLWLRATLKHNKDFDLLSERICKKRELNGKATSHEIDL